VIALVHLTALRVEACAGLGIVVIAFGVSVLIDKKERGLELITFASIVVVVMFVTTLFAVYAVEQEVRRALSPGLPAGAGSCRASSLSGVCPERSGGTPRP